jgi:peptidyl-prolyl cis-trans isomerase C
MVTLLDRREKQPSGYSTYQEPDTRVPPPPRPLFGAVSVNGVAIPEADILAEAQNHPAATPGEALEAAARALVVRALLLQRADTLAIEHGPGPTGETAEEARIQRLIEQDVRLPTATEEECRRYYDNNRERFRGEPIFEARHILLATDPRDPAARNAARARAEALAAELKTRPGAFAQLARDHSDCPSAAQDGNLGQISRGATVAEFEAALMAMAPGDTSPQPVESRYGYHVIRLERRIDGARLPYEAVSQRIAGWLEANTWSKAVSHYVAILAADAVIEGIAFAPGHAG